MHIGSVNVHNNFWQNTLKSNNKIKDNKTQTHVNRYTRRLCNGFGVHKLCELRAME